MFKNIYHVKIISEMIITDEEDAINSEISIENKVETIIGETGLELEIKNIEILDKEHFYQTHHAGSSPDIKLQKVEEDDGTYYYKILNNYGETFVSKIKHKVIDGKDYVEQFGNLYLIKEYRADKIAANNNYGLSSISILGGYTIGGPTPSTKKSTKGFKISKKISKIP